MFDLMNDHCPLPLSSSRAAGLMTALMFLICLATVQPASAASYFVRTTADSGTNSLREAIGLSNASAEQDVIGFSIPVTDPGCTALAKCTITLTSGELSVSSAATAGKLTIQSGTGGTVTTVSGNNTSRVFYLNPGADLVIQGLTITKGNGIGTTNSGTGGGIYNNQGTLTLDFSNVSTNSANTGGGIYNTGTMTMGSTTVSSNTVVLRGGGIVNDSTMTLTLSTISDNMAENGGGIYNRGTTTLILSTVSSNTVSLNAGGILNFSGTLNLTSVTTTQNRSTSTTCNCVGGIQNFTTAILKNTIVAVNTIVSSSTVAAPDFSGAVAAGSAFNLIGNGRQMSGISNDDFNGNQVGVDPKLDPTLKSNGGFTQTHALLFGSPALDRGASFGFMSDQRDFPRPVDLADYPNATGGDGADIGAFEAQTAPLAPTAATTSISGRVTTPLGRGIINIRLTLTGSNGEIRTARTTSFGYYRFDDVQTGDTYILAATGKHYTFSQPVQVLNINEETEQVNFITNSEKRTKVF